MAAVFGVVVLLRWYFGGSYNKYETNLEGKIIVVTGANTGLGFESVKKLSELGAETVILACRSEERAQHAISQIKKSYKTKIVFMQLDLNDLRSVEQFA